MERRELADMTASPDDWRQKMFQLAPILHETGLTNNLIENTNLRSAIRKERLLSRFLLRCSDPIPSGVRSGREMKPPVTSVSVHRGRAEACCIRKGLAGLADERLLDRKESKALTQI
jgi:hypothetical protein